MCFTIRPAQPDDMEFILQSDYMVTFESLNAHDQERIPLSRIQDLVATEDFRVISNDLSRVLIGEMSGIPCGLIWFGEKDHHLSGETEGWIYLLRVSEDFRGAGIGRALIDAVIEIFAARKTRSVGLMVSSHNEGAIRLYEKMGFSDETKIMRVYPAEVARQDKSVPKHS
ncbi:N-acetyltransferase [bacterium]|nr:MAG: N-acetyltransferase [bacterium]